QDGELLGERQPGPGGSQRRPLDELHGDEGPPVELAGLVDVTYVWVLEPRLSLRLADEAPLRPRVVAPEELERDHAIEAAIAGPPHFAHAALAQLGLEDEAVGRWRRGPQLALQLGQRRR